MQLLENIKDKLLYTDDRAMFTEDEVLKSKINNAVDERAKQLADEFLSQLSVVMEDYRAKQNNKIFGMATGSGPDVYTENFYKKLEAIIGK
jgi:hypothetical protein